MALLSIIIPSFKELDNVRNISFILDKLMSDAGINYEIIFVNDNYRDETWDIIRDEASKNRNIKGICFSRNFGKESAIYAGLSEAAGDCCVVMDCDMQHPPGMIIPMYQMWKNGYQIVAGVKEKRYHESKIRKLGAGIFNALVSKSVGADMDNASDFMLIDRAVVNEVLKLKSSNMFFRGIVHWSGFRKCEVHFKVHERFSGESKWSVNMLCKYAINNIVLFSNTPLHIVSACGFVSFIVSVILCMKYFLSSGMPVDIIISAVFLVGSMIMFGLGIIGVYLGKLYDTSKGMPAYIVQGRTDNTKAR